MGAGKGWFHEPGLDPMLAAGIEGGRLRFTTDFAEAAEFAAVHFIGVATPGHADGSYDLSLDPRIGPAFLKAGLGYGGACPPKGVRGLGAFAGDVGAP